MAKGDHDSENTDTQGRASDESKEKPNGKSHTLRVKVVHGDCCRSARYPLVLGHYQDDTIVDVEAVVDAWVSGRLSDRYRLGVYPGPLGSADVVHAPSPETHTVLLVGLGPVGALTLDDLALTVTHGVLRYAAEMHERDDDTRGLSFLLIGSNSPGLSIDDSVLGIVRGVLAANRALSPALGARDLRLREVELVELYEDRAESAARAVRDLDKQLAAELEPDEKLVPERHLDARSGERQTSAWQVTPPRWWRRILVSDKGSEGLHYLTLTDSARAEGHIIAPYRANIDSYVASLSGRMQWDEQAAATLFRLILPNELKARVSAERDLALVFERAQGVDWTNAAAGALPPTHFPWELIGERREARFEALALRVGLVRQLRVEDARPAPALRGQHVLVIGNSKADLLPDSPVRLPDLPGAAAEARAVARRLEAANYNVEKLVGKSGRVVLDTLLGREWLVLHVAGHGCYVADARERSGIFLNGGMRITAGEIEQLSTVPSLVFLNCCHVGTLDSVPHPSLAASVAEQLVRRGVRAVVAAGWSVDDAAARTFAVAFYDALIDGATFGAALLEARRKTREKHPKVNTWGAYQAYGDPGFVLGRRHRRTPPPAAEKPVSRRELCVRLAAFRQAPPSDTVQAHEQLEHLLRSAAREWRENAVVCEREGEAWRQIGDLDRAIAAYDTARKAGSGEISLRALLQLSNLQIRRAVADSEQSAVTAWDEALRRIRQVIELQPCGEAFAMMGSALKRLAVSAALEALRPGATVRDVLAEAAGAYADALQADESAPRTARIPGGKAFPMLNQLTLELLLGRVPDLERHLVAVETAAKRAEEAESYFERAVPANVGLLRWLASGAPVSEAGDVVQRYLDARRDASEGEFLSSVEHAEWLVQARRALVGLSPFEGEREQPHKGTGAASAEERLRAALQALAELARTPDPPAQPPRTAKHPRPGARSRRPAEKP